MKISTEYRNDLLIVRVAGRLNGSNALDFEAAVRSAASGRERPIVIDCRELSFLTSFGLRAILLLAWSYGTADEGFALCSLSPPVARTFRISGFDRVISVYASLEEALEAVKNRTELPLRLA